MFKVVIISLIMSTGDLYTVAGSVSGSCEAFFEKITKFHGYIPKHGTRHTYKGNEVLGYICRNE
jgi:predicted acyltransferase (DUF342 family)